MHSIRALCIWKPSQGSCRAGEGYLPAAGSVCNYRAICSAQRGRHGNHGATLGKGRPEALPLSSVQEPQPPGQLLLHRERSFHRAAQSAAAALPELSAGPGCVCVKPHLQEPHLRVLIFPSRLRSAGSTGINGNARVIALGPSGGCGMWSERCSVRSEATAAIRRRTMCCQQVLHSQSRTHHGPEQGSFSDEVQRHANCSEIQMRTFGCEANL